MEEANTSVPGIRPSPSPLHPSTPPPLHATWHLFCTSSLASSPPLRFSVWECQLANVLHESLFRESPESRQRETERVFTLKWKQSPRIFALQELSQRPHKNGGTVKTQHLRYKVSVLKLLLPTKSRDCSFFFKVGTACSSGIRGPKAKQKVSRDVVRDRDDMTITPVQSRAMVDKWLMVYQCSEGQWTSL
ncbi:unnamed protein product [Pleuronectes platessa]|uniref:Uncharacterized protein n=1 Tax=Pleuronectes platessa TaxID=8262 RepID=A0A9N7YFG0_PLEPL|nr:unnamed protein product [Pleuronectes platessa]